MLRFRDIDFGGKSQQYFYVSFRHNDDWLMLYESDGEWSLVPYILPNSNRIGKDVSLCINNLKCHATSLMHEEG